MDIKMSHHELEMNEYPMLVMGFGMNAYFKIIKAMLYMMFWIMIANLPLFWIFNQYDTFETMPMASLSLGNMGGAVSYCQQIPHHIESLSFNMKCPSG
jgi:hypothetical protein